MKARQNLEGLGDISMHKFQWQGGSKFIASPKAAIKKRKCGFKKAAETSKTMVLKLGKHY